MKLGKSLATPDISKVPEGPVKEYLRKLTTALENQHRLIHNDLRNQKFGNWQAGNYIEVDSSGNVTFNGVAGFYPHILAQDAEPTAGTGATQIDSGEMIFWIDTNDGDKCYLMYNYGGALHKKEMDAI